MNAPVNNHVARLMRIRKRTASYTRALVFTACLIALCTALAFRMRGIAQVRTEQVLDCHYAGSGAHTHEASCYDAQGYLVCPLVERELHTHTDACYKETRELICGLEESAGHTHTAACYDEDGNLVCGLDESAGHIHSDACYKVTRTLVCGKEEITENHVHGPGCFRTVTVDDGESGATSTSAMQQGDGYSYSDDDPSPIVTDGEVAKPAQELEGVLKLKDADGNEYVALVVGVKAPQGALPEGTTLKVAWTSAQDIADQDLVKRAEAAVKKANTKATAAQLLTSIDVSFEDAKGNEIQPTRKVELKVSYDGIRTAEHPALVRTLDEAARARFHKTDDIEVVRSAKVVNQLDEDTSTGDENTFKIKTSLATTFMVVDVTEEDATAAESAQEAQAADETPAEAEAVVESPTVVIGEDAESDQDGESSNTVSPSDDGEKPQLVVVDVNLSEESKASQFEGVLTNVAGEPVLIVRANAPEGALPEGVTMHVKRVNNLTVKDAVDKVVAEEREGAVTNIQAVDITFVDAEGNEIEPTKPITVTMTSTLIEQYEQPLVVHVDNAGNAEVVHALSERQLKKRDLQPADNELVFDADQFSTYCIVITTLEKELVASDGNTYEVKVDCPAEAGIPQDAELEVTELLEGDEGYDSYLDQAAKAVTGNGTADELSFARLFDISILVDGEKVQPKASVAVKVTLADTEAETMSVVHFGKNHRPEVLNAKTDGNTVSFTANGFSIYAITGDQADENKRIGYRFWYNDGTQNVLLSTQYFRYKDVHPDDPDHALTLYQPSIPGMDESTWNRIFNGWSKSATLAEPLYTMDNLNAELSALPQSDYDETTVIDLYANLTNVYYVTYVDVNPNNVLATDIIPKVDSGDTTFTIKTEGELRPTISVDTQLNGWAELDDPSTVYEPGQEGVVINENMTLYPAVNGGHWLVFDDNDLIDDGTGNMVSGGASFTPPSFYLNEVTSKPTDPVWTGYEFGGWFTDADCTTPFEFGSELQTDTTVYAKWIPSSSSYRVVIWKQSSSDDVGLDDEDKTYDYVYDVEITENVKTGDIVDLDTIYTRIYGNNGTSSDIDKGYLPIIQI